MARKSRLYFEKSYNLDDKSVLQIGKALDFIIEKYSKLQICMKFKQIHLFQININRRAIYATNQRIARSKKTTLRTID